MYTKKNIKEKEEAITSNILKGFPSSATESQPEEENRKITTGVDSEFERNSNGEYVDQNGMKVTFSGNYVTVSNPVGILLNSERIANGKKKTIEQISKLMKNSDLSKITHENAQYNTNLQMKLREAVTTRVN